MTSAGRLKRRLLQIGLLQLLVVTNILGVVLGWIGLYYIRNNDRPTCFVWLGTFVPAGSSAAVAPSDEDVLREVRLGSVLDSDHPLRRDSQATNVRIVRQLIAQTTDPVRAYPLIGSAEVCRAHYRYWIYYRELSAPDRLVSLLLGGESGVEVVDVYYVRYHLTSDTTASNDRGAR